MISPEEALEKLANSFVELPAEIRATEETVGMVLAEDVVAPVSMPSFRQSAMDGYALCLKENCLSYSVVGEVAAGSSENPALLPGQCVRIFTGAMVPDAADTVIQQELVVRLDETINITGMVAQGKNIRPVGEQIKTGDLALGKGTLLSPAAIGFLAGLGLARLAVIRRPKIVILTTGNELVEPGNKIAPGQIFESNSFMLGAALDDYHFANYTIQTVEDDYDATKKQIAEALDQADMLILTGGISVGDYDFVGKALLETGVSEVFYKVSQKPGKPIYMGEFNKKCIAALPGNPAAALTCFYIYVLPVLNTMTGKGFTGLEKQMIPMKNAWEKKGSRAVYLKAGVEEGMVSVLTKQSSAMLSTFARADGLVYLPADKMSIDANEEVVYYKFRKNGN